MPQPDAQPASARNSWAWIPTLYLAEGLPNAIVVIVSVVLYKELGISNAKITFYTALFYLPWVIKPLWSPVVDLLRTRRRWIWQMQLVIGGTLAALAAALPAANFFAISLLLFWLLAFSSATHDIAADGFYILALNESQQAFFVGVRNTFYRVANLLIKGSFVILVGWLETRLHNAITAWTLAFAGLAALFLAFGLYHALILPCPPADRPGTATSLAGFFKDFLATFAAFFRKPNLLLPLLFLLFYRFGEAQLLPVLPLFLLDAREAGGLGLTKNQFGLLNGTIGVMALMAGGILGGVLASRHGLRAWLWPMVLIMHLPAAAFIFLAYQQPENLWTIGACLAIEQFGYGFGFTAYMLYMLYLARGPHPTAHYAICTGFMALGLMLPGTWSGGLQEALGYPHFFIWAMLAMIPGFIVTALVPLDREFGKKA